MKRSKMLLSVIIAAFITIIVGKSVSYICSATNIGSFVKEKKDILRRRDFLIEKIMTSPKQLIKRMPAAIGDVFQGEWALYSCSMLSASLVNISKLYPETKDESVMIIDSLIRIVMSPEIRHYDYVCWGEDPLESLDGDNDHVSYISILAWMIAGYKQIGGDDKYDELYHSLCSTMNRRMLSVAGLNLQTYPGQDVYIPDMLVAVVALKLYSKQYGGKYDSTIEMWLDSIKENCLGESSRIISSIVHYDYDGPNYITIRGSFTALSCYYLTFIDEEFAKEQYERLKKCFYKRGPIAGIKEYYGKSPILAFDIDAGPILFGLSPSGTAFGIGPSTYFGDTAVRKKLLHTAELAGSTITTKGKSHYMLADIALVGEAITLAMRTATPWYK